MNRNVLDRFPAGDLVNMEPSRAFELIVRHAAEIGASDLFFMSDERRMEVAVRRLGAVQTLAFIALEQGRHILTHVKANSGMDIAERRRPADGRWIHDFSGRRLDLRVNCLPTLHGEDMTLRIWDRQSGLMQLDELGMTAGDVSKLRYMMGTPGGLILVTGPTGTGKTTTLYACLQFLNRTERKINTLEDPIEFDLEGIRQSQVNAKLGVDFPDLLRSVLRQAPHVIMVGEVRDEATATTAVRAANSGHLVLATLHSPIAGGAVQTMLALGANPFFLSTSLLGVIAQRLIRTLCPHCRVPYDISEAPQTFEEIAHLLEPGEGQTIFGPGGCDKCYDVGYVGRTGIFEVMTLNHEIRRMVTHARPSEEIEEAAIRGGMLEFRRGALLKVAKGITSTEEIVRDVPAEFLGVED